MLDPVVIALSLFAAVTCLIFYVASNRELRKHLWGSEDSDTPEISEPPAPEQDCR